MSPFPVPRPDTIIAGKYRVIGTIGRGGMGVVLEAEQLRSGKRVAVKCLHPSSGDQQTLTKRLVREARAAARVKHPYVVDIYDIIEEASTEQVFLVMELLEGEPLTKLLARKNTPPHEIIALLQCAMRGVMAAHAQGITHRDIKPDNIFLVHVPGEPHPLVKVLDFGISKMQGTLQGSTGAALVGTPHYMAYEQFDPANKLDARCDVYAFSVILYEALTGHSPYEAENFMQLVYKIIETTPVPPRELQPTIPAELERVIQRGMRHDREQRTPTLERLVAELTPFASAAGFTSGEDSLSLADTLLSAPPERAGRTPGSKRLAVVLSFAVAVGLTVGAIVWLRLVGAPGSASAAGAAVSGEQTVHAPPLPAPTAGQGATPPDMAAKALTEEEQPSALEVQPKLEPARAEPPAERQPPIAPTVQRKLKPARTRTPPPPPKAAEPPAAASPAVRDADLWRSGHFPDGAEFRSPR